MSDVQVDREGLRDLQPAAVTAFIAGLHEAIAALRNVPVPVLARLHGHVLGGALELVLAADLRLAGAACRLGMLRVGMPSVIEAALLPGLIGWGRTAELCLMGETIDAVEAARWGLFTRAVSDAALDAEIQAWLERLLALPPRALRMQKALLARWRETDLASAIRLSMDAFAMGYATDEPRRAIQAFLDRSRPGAP